MNLIKHFLKPFSFIPALLVMYMIFGFSAQDGDTSSQLSYQISYEIAETGSRLIGADLAPYEIEELAGRIHTPVRKVAHMTEYCVLAISLMFPLYVYGLHGIVLLLSAALLSIGFAATDEFHQSFVAGRSPEIKDVLIDSIGVLFGTFGIRLIGWIRKKTIFHHNNKKKEIPANSNPLSEPVPMPRQTRRYPLRDHENTYVPYEPYYEDEYYEDDDAEYLPSTSDRLSEDMSLRNLLHNIKERKK